MLDTLLSMMDEEERKQCYVSNFARLQKMTNKAKLVDSINHHCNHKQIPTVLKKPLIGICELLENVTEYYDWIKIRAYCENLKSKYAEFSIEFLSVFPPLHWRVAVKVETDTREEGYVAYEMMDLDETGTFYFTVEFVPCKKTDNVVEI